MGKEAKDILTRLLERNPRKRLGAKRDYEEIKNHEWFKGLDWNIVYLRNLKPPLPKLEQIPDDIIPLEVIYGKLDDTETIINRLSNWTFISI